MINVTQSIQTSQVPSDDNHYMVIIIIIAYNDKKKHSNMHSKVTWKILRYAGTQYWQKQNVEKHLKVVENIGY